MKRNIVTDIEKIIHSDNSDKESETVRNFEEGIKMMEGLRKQGLIKPKENRLLDAEEKFRQKRAVIGQMY